MANLWISNSYAKINLGLNVLEKLEKGYHAIETGFCFIEWSDRFEVKPGRMHLEMSDPKIPVDDSNLIVKAIKLLQQEAGLKDEYNIKVEKNIPAGAGLGGGSSNAATTLRMMNKVANLGLSQQDLLNLGRKLGADVPFFIKGTPGFATGLGDEIEELDLQPDAWIVSVFPNIESSTAEAYQMCEPKPEPEFSLRNLLMEEEPEEWRYLLENDLEKAVFPRHHLVGNLKDQFYEFGAEYASMSGSGSSVFGVFKQDFVAINAYESFHKLGFPANLTRPKFKPDLGIYLKDE
ncbi:MAG: 4-(cytidine 5'-diphospho)-2-C-methyl-D-erythritol kinase [Gracilimonas sp.]|uniref:4-(cytidine 5'-diphospho)-2-C-methyl-D-erythritol kinase n=1 Tax=Gracilimonas sp. TaxID=1974203 RepID=UPI0019C74837|nr:4-(cytidine 5'-diphospho)-2-C-methyl-D-erythritol kinase [Gracilimonas sp.]MBD3617198.1 4-(cytidine 5'-diphospho)-2-C-methyl-D-erythritol kinase [Gracilimonas sp.]